MNQSCTAVYFYFENLGHEYGHFTSLAFWPISMSGSGDDVKRSFIFSYIMIKINTESQHKKNYCKGHYLFTEEGNSKFVRTDTVQCNGE